MDWYCQKTAPAPPHSGQSGLSFLFARFFQIESFLIRGDHRVEHDAAAALGFAVEPTDAVFRCNLLTMEDGKSP